MNILGIIHVIAALLTITFAIYTSYQVFHWYSLKHRIEKMTAKMKPLIIGRGTKEHILEIMKIDGFSQNETEELYDLLQKEINARRNQATKA
ncbi:MAG: hypothetical protein ACP5N2_05670 [Candidatus Nanoarchaeia archaeon]